MFKQILIKSFFLLTAVSASLFYSDTAQAAPFTIVGFEMEGLLGTEVTFDATSKDINLQTATISRGAGITPSALNNAFSATGYVAAGTKADALSNDEYFEITLESKNNHRLFLNTLNYNIRRSGTGPNAFQWQYSLDNFDTAGVDVGAEGSYTGTATNGVAMPAIDLSAVPDLQDLPSGTKVTFRLYAWGASAGTGTFAIGRRSGDDLDFVGEVLSNKLATFEFAGQNGNQVSSTATTQASNLKPVVLSRGSGLLPSSLLNAFSSTHYTAYGAKADALGNSDCVELTFEADDFYRLNFDDLHFNARRSPTGPVSYQWQYSLDDFATAGVDLGAEGFYDGTADTGVVMPSINLSGVPALQNVKKVAYRLCAWGATTTAGTFAIGRRAGDDLVFTGIVTSNKIVAFDPAGENGDQVIFNATTLDVNLQNSWLSRGAGINPAFLLAGFSSNDFVVGGNKADAISNDEYIQFQIESNPSYEIFLGFLDSKLRRSGTGPNAYQWQYSLDNFATAGVDLGAQFAYLTSENSGTVRPRIDMSALPALQSIQPGNPVTFRLYAWGATGDAGTFAVGRLDGDDLAVIGEVKIKTYNVIYLAGAGGSITGNTSQVINHGAGSTSVTAVPDTGYHFVKWSDDSTDNPRIDANVTADLSVTAEFAINNYTLIYTAGSNGSLTGLTLQIINHGSDGAPVTAMPNKGYEFTDWSDSSTQNPRSETNVTSDLSLTANFAPLSVSSGGGGGMFLPPAGVGSGKKDVTVAMDAVKEVGEIDGQGLNILAFIRSRILFQTMVSRDLRLSRHELEILELDLYKHLVTIRLASEPQIFTLGVNDDIQVDLDGDKIPDLSIQFAGVYINRAELTVKSLLYGQGALTVESIGVQHDQIPDRLIDQKLSQRLSGRILLQVEERGEAWYVRTGDLKRYYLADGNSAYAIMRYFSLGITNSDLAKLPSVASVEDMNQSSSVCSVNPMANRLKGKILLQVEKNGEAWYVDPIKCRAIYMADGNSAYQIMRYLGLGITNNDLAKIQRGYISDKFE